MMTFLTIYVMGMMICLLALALVAAAIWLVARIVEWYMQQVWK